MKRRIIFCLSIMFGYPAVMAIYVWIKLMPGDLEIVIPPPDTQFYILFFVAFIIGDSFCSIFRPDRKKTSRKE